MSSRSSCLSSFICSCIKLTSFHARDGYIIAHKCSISKDKNERMSVFVGITKGWKANRRSICAKKKKPVSGLIKIVNDLKEGGQKL